MCLRVCLLAPIRRALESIFVVSGCGFACPAFLRVLRDAVCTTSSSPSSVAKPLTPMVVMPAAYEGLCVEAVRLADVALRQEQARPKHEANTPRTKPQQELAPLWGLPTTTGMQPHGTAVALSDGMSDIVSGKEGKQMNALPYFWSLRIGVDADMPSGARPLVYIWYSILDCRKFSTEGSCVTHQDAYCVLPCSPGLFGARSVAQTPLDCSVCCV